jgi:hypothetical protein
METQESENKDYKSLFIIRKANLPPARFGKSVNIRKEHHDRITQVVHVIGGSEISIFGYIDNVLAHHFEMFKDEITQSFNDTNLF